MAATRRPETVWVGGALALFALAAGGAKPVCAQPAYRVAPLPPRPAYVASTATLDRLRFAPSPFSKGPHFLRYYSISGTTPFFITLGPDNDFWFTTGDQPGSIGTLGPKEPYVLYPLPPSGPTVTLRITTGPDGNLWSTLDGGIAKMTPGGVATVYPTNSQADLGYITVGPDGNLWFTEHDANMYARITPSGQITEFPFDDIGVPNGIVTGPDGKLWVCEQGALGNHQTFGRIEQIDPTTGKILNIYPLTPNSWENVPEDITVGADHKMWFTQFEALNQTVYLVASITHKGKITEYMTPNQNAGPGSPVLAGDGNVWFSEAYAANLARVTPQGVITEFPLPQDSAPFPTAPYGVARGPGKGLQLWFADYQNGRIGQFVI